MSAQNTTDISVSLNTHTLNIKIPVEAARFTMLQPHLVFPDSATEPFQLETTCKTKQLDAIKKTIQIVCEESPHFILFPEYSVPNREGVELINAAVFEDGWPNNSVVMAGVDGMSKHEFLDSLSIIQDHLVIADEAFPNSIPKDDWVNCCFVWVKEQDGSIKSFVQPKLCAAWPEENVNHSQMYKGKFINFFKCQFENNSTCSFFGLTCFDWIGRRDGQQNPRLALKLISEANPNSAVNINWVFLLQHNRKPNHPSFLESTKRLMDGFDEFADVDTRDAVIVICSTAADSCPTSPDEFGFSSFLFGASTNFENKRCCPLTYSMKPTCIDHRRETSPAKDAVFREMGECIHCCSVRIPRFLRQDPTDRTLPIRDANVYPVSDIKDPRMPSGPVAAAVKWLNDQFDKLASFVTRHFSNENWYERLEKSRDSTIEKYRTLKSKAIEKRVELSTASDSCLVDEWSDKHEKGLAHVVNTVSILVSTSSSFEVVECVNHARIEETGVEIAAVTGTSHAECREHFEKKCQSHHGGTIVVTRDLDNTSIHPRESQKYFEADTQSGKKIIAFQSLLGGCQTVEDEKTFLAFIEEQLNVGEPKIV